MSEYFDQNQPGFVDWLLSLDKDSFIKNVFQAILGRDPDHVGAAHYLQLLEKSDNRLQIIADLFTSKEAIKRGQRKDITDAVFHYKHPVRSRIIKLFQLERYRQTGEASVRATASDSGIGGPHVMDSAQYEGLFNAIHGKGNALHDQLLKLEYRLDNAQAVEVQEILGDADTRYLFNLSTSNHWRSHPVGIVRVEREIATYLLRFRNIDFVLWDSQARCLRKLGRIHAERILTPEWCDAQIAMAPYDPAHMAEAVIRPGDIYVSMGLDWDHAPTSDVLNYLGPRGAKSFLACFDTVPVQFPELLVRDEIGQQFRQHLVEMAHGATGVWAISHATKRDLERFWESARLETVLPKVFTVPLASYASSSRLPSLNAEDRSILRDVFSKGSYVLYVSSVEPRKNHKLMLDIWRELYAERGSECPQFVYVGMTGWGCGDILQRIPRMQASIAGKITGLHRVSDNLLQHLYYNCSFTVFPSLYEGWGLAATEAMQFGKVSVVSDNSSLNEATQYLMPTLHPLDFLGWKSEIERLFDDIPYRRSLEQRIATEYRPLTWREVGERFCRNLVLEN